jgi:hypothetical protein
MAKPIIYTLENLADAREFLSKFPDPVILTNKDTSTRYYGMMIIDYIFKKLTEEFLQIVEIIVNVGTDHSALLTAIKLNYKNIVYTGASEEAKKLINFTPLPNQHSD